MNKMCIKDILDEIKQIQSEIEDILENEDSFEENFASLKIILEDKKISGRYQQFKLILKFIVNLSNNHHRDTSFFFKIEQIILFYKYEIMKKFSNYEIFNIFKSNKRILLFLLEEEIIKIDNSIFIKIMSKKYMKMKYPHFFAIEIKPFFKNNSFEKDEEDSDIKSLQEIINQLPDEFEEKRKNGENENYVCEMIRKDIVIEFISFTNRINLSKNSFINESIFETNQFLLKRENTTLIEYAAFYGSLEIFNYLRMTDANLTPSLWLYAIHGKNPEIIHLLEECHIKPDDDSYIEIFIESIKCHHKDISNYFGINYIDDKKQKSQFVLKYIFKYHNFEFIQNDLSKNMIFYYSCEYDYYTFVDILLENGEIDINMKNVSLFDSC